MYFSEVRKSHQLMEQEDCCKEAKDYIWACLTSQSSSEWPSAAPLSSLYLHRKRQNENTCHSYLKRWLKIWTGTRKCWGKVKEHVTSGNITDRPPQKWSLLAADHDLPPFSLENIDFFQGLMWWLLQSIASGVLLRCLADVSIKSCCDQCLF